MPVGSPLLEVMPIVVDPKKRPILPDEYEVESIVGHRWNRAKGAKRKKGGGHVGRLEYEVLWRGFPGQNTFEPFEHFANSMETLLEYIRLTPIRI